MWAYSTAPTGAPSRLRHSKGLLKIKSVLGAFGSVWERKNPLGDKGSWVRIPPLRHLAAPNEKRSGPLSDHMRLERRKAVEADGRVRRRVGARPLDQDFRADLQRD